MKTITVKFNVPTFPRTRATFTKVKAKVAAKTQDAKMNYHSKRFVKHATALGLVVPFED
jgi:hypothetical protein